MMPTNVNTPKAELKFPVEWEFRIIVFSDQLDSAKKGLESVFCRFGNFRPLTQGDASKQGKYQVLSTQMTMIDRAMLDAISRELAAVPGVKMIL